MHNFQTNYDKILKVLNTIEPKSNFLHQIRKPKLTDKELIAINLTSEFMSIDSEYQLFRLLPEKLLAKIERSVYNRRRRRLFDAIELIREQLSNFFNEFEDCFIVDSMPLEVCKLSRSGRSRICKEQTYCTPDKGYCATQSTSYYGYKLHAVCSVKGVFKSLDISPASVHDIHYLKDIKTQLNDCLLIGDKGYLSADIQLNLFDEYNIKLSTPMRKNQYNYKQQPYVFRKSRKRIETLFSQLCDQFMIRRNYAKSFEGFKTRILSKITALTMIQYINQFIYNRNINNIKIKLS
ncbi:IS982 family transposase [Zunongwangia pacifica]|uniref:IS982 family transposase n=1 Tax=Zunongwangia pacifica TaxID=2911062 RepID=A0A9X2A0A8_9FLAO|nr:IS982 family transposase [Zunongwangia pacifica]MCL6220988.1 IS982 family transposase [Zunongwangia pacifica]